MRIYVGNLPFTSTDDELRSLFEEHGPVNSATIITDRDTGRSRGFGFIDMEDEAGRKAIEALNNHEISGRALVVNEARPREERGGGGGGGGRRY